MLKEKYVEADIEVITFDEADIITESELGPLVQG